MFGELPVIVVDGSEWFGATEAATALSFSNPYKAIDNHVDQEDLTVHTVLTNGGQQNKKFINESGLYALIFGAAKQGNNQEIKEKAKAYKGWVTREVLPTIRKHGAYLTPDTLEQTMQDPDFLIGILNGLKKEQEERKRLEQKVIQDQPKVLFAEAVEGSSNSILIGQLAMLLKQNGINIGQNRLYDRLREEGFLCKSGDRKNLPTQRSMEMNLFEVQERTISASTETKTRFTTRVTGRGQIYFLNKFKNKGA